MSVRLVNPAHDSDHLHGAVVRILTANWLCSMATAGGHSKVHIHTAFFAFNEDLDLCFLSHPESVHAHTIARAPQMAVTVFDGQQPWGAAQKGLQLFGSCARTTGAGEEAARALYAARFPLYDDFMNGRLAAGGPTPSSSFFQLRFYTFTPASLKILDEDVFGDDVLVEAEVVTAGSGR